MAISMEAYKKVPHKQIRDGTPSEKTAELYFLHGKSFASSSRKRSVQTSEDASTRLLRNDRRQNTLQRSKSTSAMGWMLKSLLTDSSFAGAGVNDKADRPTA